MQEEYADGSLSPWELLNTDPAKAMEIVFKRLRDPDVVAVRVADKKNAKPTKASVRRRVIKRRRKRVKASRRQNRGKR